ncbi:MAG: hypothetical protein OXI45_11575 [Acidobacteriota bacterium]|nr:hypothetical protein [Acidobacteriota bacterium]
MPASSRFQEHDAQDSCGAGYLIQVPGGTARIVNAEGFWPTLFSRRAGGQLL